MTPAEWTGYTQLPRPRDMNTSPARALNSECSLFEYYRRIDRTAYPAASQGKRSEREKSPARNCMSRSRLESFPVLLSDGLVARHLCRDPIPASAYKTGRAIPSCRRIPQRGIFQIVGPYSALLPSPNSGPLLTSRTCRAALTKLSSGLAPCRHEELQDKLQRGKTVARITNALENSAGGCCDRNQE
jgi:hypothetical protein